MALSLHQLLQQSTVKLMPADGRDWGTGFFVASKQIITCAHVVQGYETEGVPVFWQGTALSVARVEQIFPSPIDLALLLLDTADEEILPLSVLLDETFTPFDRLYVYGYPDDFPEGGSATIRCEGDVREAEVTLIKAQAGQIRPGHSGSPALNFETGKVCGIVSDTRGRSTDLGGLLIPISTVFSHFPELKAQNQAAHPQDSLWLRLLSEQAQQSSTRSPFAAASFHFSTYRPETWTGREDALFDLTQALQKGSRLLLIYGMTGIGKTTLAERLAADFATPETYHRVAFDEGDRSQNFSRGTLAILQALGDDTAQQLPDEQLLPHLLKTLEKRPCWLQLDSVEYLLSQNDAGESHFSDSSWLDFLYQLLAQPSNTRIVLTSQALPTDLIDRCLRYDNLWYEFSLAGLERDRCLDLFCNHGVTPKTDEDAQHLYAIADYFEGHPLILKMIAGDIGKRPFNGNVNHYWQEYYSQRQSQLAPKLRQSQEQRARNWVNQTIQSLPDLPRQMLQQCAVFRRPVPETFYPSMLPEIAITEADSALMLLKDHNLVEENDLQAGLYCLRQHNLIREIAYRNLNGDRSVWDVAERRAAYLWLNFYQPPANAQNIEIVRGYLEAFGHYCQVEHWEKADEIYESQLTSTNQTLHRQLFIWGYYEELIGLSCKLVDEAPSQTKRLCLNNVGNCYRALSNIEAAVSYYQQALQCAREVRDLQGEGRTLGNLGLTYYRLGDYEKAISYYQQALRFAREAEDRQGESYAIGNLGIAHYMIGQFEQAISFNQQILSIAKDIKDRIAESNALCSLGLVYEALGQYEQAIDYYQKARQLARETGDRQGEGNSLGNIGNSYSSLGQNKRAISFYQKQLVIAREIQDRRGEGNALGNIGIVYCELGQYDRAIDYHHQHLAIVRETQDRRGEGYAYGNLGLIQQRLRQYQESFKSNQEALQIFREIGSKQDEARTLKNLAELHQATGERELARQYAQQALALATELGIPLKAECEALLAEL